MNSETSLKLLRELWGYSSFRPKQEEIISAILESSDVAAVMPTGGGKSLCYQLPAVALGKTALVVSPLLALMHDQIAQLTDMAIPAAAVNSTVPRDEQSRIMQKARNGDYRLLYLSPERLARADTLTWLSQLPLGFFAIDEAHCISEWGHEFRPEYRQLNRLRAEFPNVPIAAFTASATRRVRHDILEQLQLRTPRTFISSFFRSNLRYTVRPCKTAEQEQLLLAALSARQAGSAIVYAPTIARVEEIAAYLVAHGVPAVSYHAKMETSDRRRNQERWMSDETPVLVGTVAFGMGINKPSVRVIVHLALPKSIEQFYQEAGRAGRDGLPSECFLLWRKQDAGLHAHFIEQVQDRAERERSWERYHKIRDFVESRQCRHRQICLYFGETPKWTSCGACDVCAGASEFLDVRPHSVIQAPAVPQNELTEYLRAWRRDLAAARGVPAFVIFQDTVLAEICRQRPRSLRELASVPGIGPAKLESLGEQLLSTLDAFDRGARVLPRVPSTFQETGAMLSRGMSFEQIATARELKRNTVITHVAEMVELGAIEFDPKWVRDDIRAAIEKQARHLGMDRLKPIKEALPAEVDYPEIRLVVAALRRSQRANSAQIEPAAS